MANVRYTINQKITALCSHSYELFYNTQGFFEVQAGSLSICCLFLKFSIKKIWLVICHMVCNIATCNIVLFLFV